jgi:hypothetical protein
MYCTFLALKAHNDLTVEMGPGEYTPAQERKLFQAYVPSHSLCPVWCPVLVD